MSLRHLSLLSFLVLVPLVALTGCGGGVSGPNPNTQAGLGTLIVRIPGSGNEGAVVFLDNAARTTERGRAIFYNVTPGRHYVRAISQSASSTFPASANVNIVADKTITISLEVEAPIPTRTPLGF